MARRSRTFSFQGELGAFSHAAGQKLLGMEIAPLPRTSFREVFETLKSGAASFAVLPIENTLHGSIHENYDHLLDYGFPVVGETSLRISHQLIAMPGVRFRDIRRVFSHPVALNQCRTFFQKHPSIEAAPFYDTAGSVKMLSEQTPAASGAIASETAASIYGGVIHRRNIEDDAQNFTRFFLLSKQTKRARPSTGEPKPSAEPKTSIVFSTPNGPGALFKVLACFALRDLNLTKIESRPLRGKPWEYLFYVDLLGSVEDQPVKNALANLAELTQFLKILGSYEPTS